MFAVLFEVHPCADRWDSYLDHAKMLRPELEAIEGFVDNIRYASLTRPGCLLSLSSWRDEKALVRWRTQAKHHHVQAKGREAILRDYHLRVGQITEDTHLPEGQSLREQRLDETQTGAATTAILVCATRPRAWTATPSADAIAGWFGLGFEWPGLVAWDVFDAVLTPGDLILLSSWRSAATADAVASRMSMPENARRRRVRIVRDYGMFDRREAPQYYPDVAALAQSVMS